MAKGTVYIEADDEITTVIDKVLSAKEEIVAVVLPKRATVFQSVVNLKLLKKASEEAKKRVVLISSEPAIESISAVVGMHIAQSLSSKPYVPKRAKPLGSETITSKELDVVDVGTVETPEEAVPADDKPQSDTIELDNTQSVAEELPEGTLALAGSAKVVKKKRFKIPDFSSFRLRMGLGITAVVLLIVGWVFGFVILPKASITINTDTSSQPVSMDFIARADITEINLETGELPAKKAEISKEDKVTVPATGEKNVGEKASGEAKFSGKICGTPGVPDDVPAGTGISSNGKTYITLEDVSFSFASIGGGCINFTGDTVGISAQASGANFNVGSGTSFAVAGRSDATAVGSASGGTDAVVKVVSDDDVNKAKEQLKGIATAAAITELNQNLTSQQLQALPETMEESAPVVKTSIAVDAEAPEVTVTQTVKYSMLGVSSSELGSLLDNRITKSLEGQADKNVRSNGLDAAVYRLTARTSVDNQTITLDTIAILGPEFDENAIRNEVAGKKRGDIEKMLESRDGVRSVGVEYSPFWITTTPKSADKIKIIINEVEN
ncbi:hypothetical protein KBB49_02555 [Candidatus Saccharibacteria bacterium]|nr:hypothetical protein [Candidatus Saccharibacteria bacterium]